MFSPCGVAGGNPDGCPVGGPPGECPGGGFGYGPAAENVGNSLEKGVKHGYCKAPCFTELKAANPIGKA